MNINLNFNIEPVFLDLETLDNKPFSPIIELSIIDVHGSPLFDDYIYPGEDVYLSNYKINYLGYNQEELDNAKTLSYYIPRIKSVTDGKAIVTYGGSDLDKLPWLKEHTIHLDCCKRFSQRYGQFNKYFGNHTWISLANACLEIGYSPNGTPHRSIVDSESCRKVWLHLDEIEANFAFPFKKNKLIKGTKNIELIEEHDNEPF